jgi:hypothetical protein
VDQNHTRAPFRVRYGAGAFPFSTTLGLIKADVAEAIDGSWFAQRRVVKAIVAEYERGGGHLKFPHPTVGPLGWGHFSPPPYIEV